MGVSQPECSTYVVSVFLLKHGVASIASSQVNASLVRVCDNATCLVQSDYISVCYGNIKNIRAVKIFTVRAFHFFSLIFPLYSIS